jgi:hypothetical protein
MALSANGQVVAIIVDILCCTQYHIYGAIHMQLYATSLPLISTSNFHAHSNVVNKSQCGFLSICRQMMYVNTFCNLFTSSLTNIIFHYFIHPFDEWICSYFYKLSIIILQPIKQIYFFIISFILWQMDSKYPYLLQLIYNYFITNLMNVFFNYFIHPLEQWIMFLSFATNL